LTAVSLISRRLSFKGRAAVASIAVSFIVIIIAICISDGFREEIHGSLVELAGDAQVTTIRSGIDEVSAPIEVTDTLVRTILNVEGVASVRPVVCNAAVVRAKSSAVDAIHGVMFRAVEGSAPICCSDTVQTKGNQMFARIPRNLASLLGLGVGDKMLAYFIAENASVRSFTVAEIYDAIVTDDDRLVVFCNFADLRRSAGLEDGQATSLEVCFDHRHSRDNVLGADAAAQISYKLFDYSQDSEGGQLLCSRTADSYSRLFDWLHLIDGNVSFILVLMIIVAGFNMTGGLLILLFEHMQTIGLLKTMGMKFKDIAKTFLLAAARLVLRGMIIGNALGLGLCLVQRQFHLLKLDPTNYFVSFVPVSISWARIFTLEMIAFVAIMLILLVPCRFISKIDPSKTIR